MHRLEISSILFEIWELHLFQLMIWVETKLGSSSLFSSSASSSKGRDMENNPDTSPVRVCGASEKPMLTPSLPLPLLTPPPPPLQKQQQL
ncbi:hypothetical protein V6N12_076211 [Hibiscus sabdariffa]|uniref:Uncharacterized protein n=1 Tax=Hibiscus sabdariffa TaxID=183260 RepID=A0ABR2B288_9ROSI